MLLNADEQTIVLNPHTTEVVENIWSFQYFGEVPIRWSTIPFTDDNEGAKLFDCDEIILSAARNIYFKTSFAKAKIHCRAVQL